MKKFIAIILALTTLFSVTSLTATAKTVTNTEIADYARTFEGVPYVWSGHSPSGFDCSGFVNYVFTQKGIPLDNDSKWYKTVSNYGVEVTAEEALPGDIVVWPGHVGIYLGDGMCISALSGDTKKVTVHTVASFTGGSVVLYGRPNGVDYGSGEVSNVFYYASISRYNATLTYENGVFTATMTDPNLKERYTLNKPNIPDDATEYFWYINFTDNKIEYEVFTGYFAGMNYSDNYSATLYEMQSSVFESDEEFEMESGYSWVTDATLSVDNKTLTWQFTLPEELDFDPENMRINDAGTYEYSDISNSNNSFFEKVIDIFETIWDFIKKPFELLLSLFA